MFHSFCYFEQYRVISDTTFSHYLYCNNRSDTKLSPISGFHECTKYIGIDHLTRHYSKTKAILLPSVPSQF